MESDITREGQNMVLLRSGERYWDLELLRCLEFVGYGTRKKGAVQTKRSTNRHRHSLESLAEYWLNTVLHMCSKRLHRAKKIISTRERKIPEDNCSQNCKILFPNLLEMAQDCGESSINSQKSKKVHAYE